VIEADSYLLERILQNLFSNAASTRRRWDDRFKFRTREKESVISFYNSGPPITEEIKRPYSKNTHAWTQAFPIFKGLGLFFLQDVMNAHGGRIWLDTDPTGNAFKMSFKTAPYYLLITKLTTRQRRENMGEEYAKAM